MEFTRLFLNARNCFVFYSKVMLHHLHHLSLSKKKLSIELCHIGKTVKKLFYMYFNYN